MKNEFRENRQPEVVAGELDTNIPVLVIAYRLEINKHVTFVDLKFVNNEFYENQLPVGVMRVIKINRISSLEVLDIKTRNLVVMFVLLSRHLFKAGIVRKWT
ncbi:hypothetical protein TNCV_1907511 [Trichonephila clavipes]|nr:hypothetical protein TNCV_1907511 [Trichonephila clavipes]